MEPTLPEGRTYRSRGVITVGPVTTRIEPKSTDNSGFNPKIMYAEIEAKIHVVKTPMERRLCTTILVPIRSAIFRLNPPSKRIKASDMDMKGKRSGPINLSGCRKPVNGPATNPKTISKRIEGSFKRQASH
jgi:hypothetical protein